MDKYLLMMYLTLEQESAVKHLFLCRGWRYSKQDLSKTTEDVGPAETENPDLLTLTARKKGRRKKSISSPTEKPIAKKAKHSDNNSSTKVSTSAQKTITGVKSPSTGVQSSSSAQSADRVQTSTHTETAGSIWRSASDVSAVTVSVSGNVSTSPDASTSPRRSSRTPKPNKVYVKEEEKEASKDDDSMTLPLILSVESFAPSSTASYLPASVPENIPSTQSASTTVQNISKVDSSGKEAPEFAKLDKAIAKIEAGDPDYDPMSEGDFGDEEDDLEEEIASAAVGDSKATVTTSTAAALQEQHGAANKDGKPWFTATKMTFPSLSALGLPDRRDAASDDEVIMLQSANDAAAHDAIEQLVKKPKAKMPRGNYRHYDHETKMEIGKYAAEHGGTKTSNHFESMMGYISNSSVRLMRDYYLKQKLMCSRSKQNKSKK